MGINVYLPSLSVIETVASPMMTFTASTPAVKLTINVSTSSIMSSLRMAIFVHCGSLASIGLNVFETAPEGM